MQSGLVHKFTLSAQGLLQDIGGFKRFGDNLDLNCAIHSDGGYPRPSAGMRKLIIDTCHRCSSFGSMQRRSAKFECSTVQLHDRPEQDRYESQADGWTNNDLNLARRGNAIEATLDDKESKARLTWKLEPRQSCHTSSRRRSVLSNVAISDLAPKSVPIYEHAL